MKATVLGMRHRMKDILRALDRNEEVSVLYRGQLKGTIHPVDRGPGRRAQDYAFFNMCPDTRSVNEEIDTLRRGRHRDL